MRTCARTGGVNPALGGIIQGEDFVEAQNKWQCPSCTVLNPNRLRYCKLDGCNTARPGPRPASPPRDCMRAVLFCSRARHQAPCGPVVRYMR